MPRAFRLTGSPDNPGFRQGDMALGQFHHNLFLVQLDREDTDLRYGWHTTSIDIWTPEVEYDTMSVTRQGDDIVCLCGSANISPNNQCRFCKLQVRTRGFLLVGEFQPPFRVLLASSLWKLVDRYNMTLQTAPRSQLTPIKNMLNMVANGDI